MKVLLSELKIKLNAIIAIPGYYDKTTGDYVDEQIITKEVEGTFKPIGRKKLKADIHGFYTVSDMVFYSSEVFKKGDVLEDPNTNEKYKVIDPTKDYGYINPDYKVTVLRRVEA